MSWFIQIIGQISRLRCASLEMTTKWIRDSLEMTTKWIGSTTLFLCASAALNLTKLSSFVIVFMQNKANFKDDQMNVSFFYKKDYENKSDWTLGENKPNSKPIKANFQKAKMDVNFYSTKDYEEKCG